MTPAVSRAQWIGLTCSVALAAGAWIARREIPLGRFPADAEFVALQSEAAQLHGADDRTRDQWRQRLQALHSAMWTEADLATLQRRLGPGWQIHANLPGHETKLRRIEFSRAAVPFSAWSEFVGLIAELEARPGLRVVALDLTAGGLGARRRFTHMGFAVQVIWSASNGNAERSAFLGPLPVSSPSPAAPRGRTGALPPLRGPSAAAFGNVPALRAVSRSPSLTQN